MLIARSTRMGSPYRLMRAGLLGLTLLAGAVHADTNAIGAADGSFETDLSGATTTGDTVLVSGLGILRPVEGSQALLMTTEPDAGEAKADADVSTYEVANFTIDAAYSTLRLSFNYLTDEPNPSYANDALDVTLVLVTAGGETVLLTSDTFTDRYFEAPWTGYDRQTGFQTMVADVSAQAGTGDQVTLQLRIADEGDGRGDSAVLIDDIRLVEPGAPVADIGDTYYRINPGESIQFNGLGSTDNGALDDYRWDFGNGFIGVGPVVNMDQYTEQGVFQGSLTVTDDEGNTDTISFSVVVGDINSAPLLTSTPMANFTPDVPWFYQLAATDPEIPLGDSLTYALDSGPAGMTVDPATGLVEWTPDGAVPMTVDVSFTVTDSMGLSDSQAATLATGPEVIVATQGDAGVFYTLRSLGAGRFDQYTRHPDLGGGTHRGIGVGDMDGDGDFDVITSSPSNPSQLVYVLPRENGGFGTPIELGVVGDATNTSSSQTNDMAVGDFNADGRTDVLVQGNNAWGWLFKSNGPLVTEDFNFFASDFETGTFEAWGGASGRTGFEVVSDTAGSGANSMRVFATGASSNLSIDINPGNWFPARGSKMRFEYRIPAGTPVGLLFNVTGIGWVWFGGSPAAIQSTYPAVDNPAALIDDDTWRSVEIDLYEELAARFPQASRITEFEWWVPGIAPNGSEFWFDNFVVSRPRMVSGYTPELVPSIGSLLRGADAGDFDGDGDLDLARARTSSGYIYLMTNDGDGNFTGSASQVADPGSDPYGVLLGDFDGDDIADIIGNNSSSGDARFFKGNGDGTFVATGNIVIDTNNWTSLGKYDFDGDGDFDVVGSTFSSRTVQYIEGNGDATFDPGVVIATTSSSAYGFENILSISAPGGRAIGDPFALASQSLSGASPEGTTVDYDANNSYDDGNIVSYDWDFGDGNTASGAVASNTYNTEGYYAATVTVTDDLGRTNIGATLPVRILGQVPVADAGGPYSFDETFANNGQWIVSLDGTGSADNETSITRWEWDFDNSDGVGIDATGPQPSFAYGAPGTYTVTLTVYDGVDQPTTITTTVTISAGSGPVAVLNGAAVLGEEDATRGLFTSIVDLTGTTDDVGLEQLVIEWGDGSANKVFNGLRESWTDGDFTNGTAWTVNGGVWSVDEGVLRQTDEGNSWRWLQDLTRLYEDFEMTARFRALPGALDGYLGIVARNANTRGNTETYLIYSRDSWDAWRLYDWRTNQTLQEAGDGFDENVWYTLRIRMIGNHVEVWLTPDGGVETKQLDFKHAKYSSGSIGLLTLQQTVEWDDIFVTPLPSKIGHQYAAGDYTATLTATDFAGQSSQTTLDISAAAGAPPVAPALGPITLDESVARATMWELILDASSATDDTNVERVTVDWGDGDQMTSGILDGNESYYFATGTDLYGYNIPGARIERIVGLEDNTALSVILLEDNSVLWSGNVNRLSTVSGLTPPANSPFKIKANKPVTALMTNRSFHQMFAPSVEGGGVGKEFVFFSYVTNSNTTNTDLYIFAYEDSYVRVYNSSNGLEYEGFIPAGEYRQPYRAGVETLRIESSGRISVQGTGGDGFTTVPAANGDGAGRLFYFAIQGNVTGAMAVFAQQAADFQVYDMDTNELLHDVTLAEAGFWFQNALGTRRLRVESNGDLEVWGGDTESGTTIDRLGDDISFAGGQRGSDFLIHTLNQGVTIFAPNADTEVYVAGTLVDTLDRDGYLRLNIADYPSGVYSITTSKDVVVQTMGSANAWNNMGTQLGGTSMRHDYKAMGTYDLTVTVFDNAGQSDQVTVPVSVVGNDFPVANIDGPAEVDETGAAGGIWTASFDASGSTDDFSIATYEWDFGDGNTGTGATIDHGYTAVGDYQVTLTITDQAGQVTTETFDISITQGAPPVANTGGPYALTELDADFGEWNVTLDGTGSTDDVDVIRWQWNLGNRLLDNFEGPAINDSNWYATASMSQSDGVLKSGLPAGWGQGIVNLRNGVDRVDGVEILGRVRAVGTSTNRMMFGVFAEGTTGLSFTQLVHGLYMNNTGWEIYENGSRRGNFQGSFDDNVWYDLRIVLREMGAEYFYKRATDTDWTQMNITSGSLNSTTARLAVGIATNAGNFEFDDLRIAPYLLEGEQVNVLFEEPTSQDLSLTVWDNALQTNSADTTLTINTGDAPVAEAAGPYTVEVGAFVNLNGTGSTDDGVIQTYEWDFGYTSGGPDAPGSQTANVPMTGKGPTPRHFFPAVGTYTVTLTVTDSVGQTDTDTATVNVVQGTAPQAIATSPTGVARGGPPAYFDATASEDDYQIVEYRWDMDIAVDSDGDGDPANDIDEVGATPFWNYGSQTFGPADTELFGDDFEGVALDSTRWQSAGVTQSNGQVELVGAQGWGARYLRGSEQFARGSWSFYADLTPGNGAFMIGLKNTTTNNSFTAMPHAIYWTGASIRIYENGSNRGTVNNFSFTQGVEYEARIDVFPTTASYYLRAAGDTDWTLLTGFTQTTRTDSPMVAHVVAVSGTHLYDNIRLVSNGPFQAKLTVEDGAGQMSSSIIEVNVEDNLPPDVLTVPWVAFDPIAPHETYNGKAIHLKGIVRDADAVTYQWDFGDGTQSAVLNVTDPYDLGIVHTYPAASSGTPFVATLTVTDSAGNTGSATYNVVVKPKNLTTEINISIDEGLWYLHKEQTRYNYQGYRTGYWTTGSRAAATASAVQAFEANGHLETVNHQDNPYAETSMRGLREVFRSLGVVNIAAQTYGEPDTNGNGIGLQTGQNGVAGNVIYVGGQVMDAIATSGTPLARTVTGVDGVARRTYYDILNDMTDQYAWGQTEQGSGGAWRYAWNSSIDQSAAQWGAIGILAAEDIFGVPIPQWVKERNLVWLQGSWGGSGWGYSGPGVTRAGTPSGLVQAIMDDLESTNAFFVQAENWIAGNWNNQYDIAETNRPIYPYYALTKAMRLAMPRAIETFRVNGFDWFRDPEQGLARILIDTQQANGLYAGSEWVSGHLRSAWAVIILSRTLFVQPPVADAGEERVWGVDIPLNFDGSNSFHLDPFRSLVKYEWDFDGDGSFDFESDEPFATFTYRELDYPEPTLPQTITVRLRVTDNNIPALTDTDTVEIIIAIPPHPPVADAGGPYACTAGIPCELDGSGSFDIDPTDFIFRYQWDTDGFPFDYLNETGEKPRPIFSEGQHNVGLQVFDNGVLNDLNGNNQVEENERLSDEDFVTVTAVANLAPVADANGPHTIDEGSAVVLDASASSDPNGDVLTFAWDFDADGAFDDALGPNPSYLGVDDGDYTVTVEVTDSLLTDTASTTVTVQNVAPVVEAGPDASIDEGATLNFTGSFTDPGVQDTHTIEWDFGDGNVSSGSLTPSHVYTDDGTYTVTLTVTDDDGGVGSDTLMVLVNDLAPTVVLTGDNALTEGDTGAYDASGSTSAPDAIVGYEWDWDYDGTFDAAADSGAMATHLFPENGTFTVAVRVTDDDGSQTIGTLDVVVANANPVVEAGADQNNVQIGATIALDPATFTDAGVLDTHTATIDWGDGSSEAGSVAQGSGSGAVTGTHAYASAGNYVVTVTVTDDDGGVGSDTFNVEVVATPNTPPLVDAGPDSSIQEGQSVVSAGQFVDPDDDLWSATVDYGEGAGPQPLALNADKTFSLANVYEQDGVYIVTVTVSDDAGGSASDTAQVTVGNVAPVADAGPDSLLTEGDTLVSSGAFVDQGVLDTHTATVDYGEGAGPQPLALNADGTFNLSNLYEEDGAYTVTVVVTDNAGGGGSDTASVTVQNAPPVVEAGADQSVQVGSTLNLDPASFTDAGILDTHTASIDWGDGTTEAGAVSQGSGSGTVAGSHAYAGEGTYTVTVTVTDDDGGVGSDTFDVVVTAAPNTPPAVDAGPDASIQEGQNFSSAGQFVDPDDNTWTATVDYGEGAGPQPLTLNADKTFSLDNVYEQDGVYTVTVTVSDDAGGSASDTATVTVGNVAPIADAGPDSQLVEGDTLISSGAFVDQGVLDTHTATVDYGEGAGPQPLVLNADGTFSLSNLYEEDGTYTVTVAVTDNAGGVGSDTATIIVQNADPVVEAGADQTITLGDTVSLDPATFTDAGVEDTHTSNINWGDGTTEPGALTQGAGSGSVAGSHTFLAAGTYTVTVTVTDDDGGTGSDTLTVLVNEIPNTAPTVDAGPDQSLLEGQMLIGSGAFVDPDTDTWMATVNYGDGGGA
ncbi:MAG: PKD domain-containing protein, partial [Pseudomonadota bacterium]